MLNKNLLNLKKLNNNEIEALRKKISASDFIAIETSDKTLPKKILTTKGILNIIDDYIEETNKESKLTSCFSFGRMNCYKNSWYLNKDSYQIYSNLIFLFFINNKDILLDYLNTKYPELNLTLDDITYSGIKKQSRRLNISEKMFNKKNNKTKNGDIYISKKDDIFLMTKNKEIYLLKENKNETRRNVSKSEFRRNGMLYKDERDVGAAIFM